MNNSAKFCPQCRFTLTGDEKYCGGCGFDLMAIQLCSSCNEVIKAGATFCSNCGHQTGNKQVFLQGQIFKNWREIALKIFPNFQKITRVKRSDFLLELFLGAIASAGAAVIVGMILFVITDSEPVSRAAMELVLYYVFLRYFGHHFLGRILDAGLMHNNTYLKIGTLYFGFSVIGIFSHIAFVLGQVIGALGLLCLIFFESEIDENELTESIDETN